jgi:hypothetical protein
VDAAHIGDFELADVGYVFLAQPFEAIVEADDLQSFVDRFDRCGTDDTVNAGGGAAADQDADFFFRCP